MSLLDLSFVVTRQYSTAMASEKSNSFGFSLVACLLFFSYISMALSESQVLNSDSPFGLEDSDDKNRFALLAWRAANPPPVPALTSYPYGGGPAGRKRTFSSAGLKQFLFTGRQDVRLGRR